MTVILYASLWFLVAVLGMAVWRRKGRAGLVQARTFALRQLSSILPRVVLALLAAAFITTLVPKEWIGSILGEDSGIKGIFLASIVGGMMPAGPMTSYPAVLFLWQSGAGTPQLVALLTGWAVFAFHRVFAFELPIMGWRFTVLRLGATALAPPFAGLLAAGVLALLGNPEILGN